VSNLDITYHHSMRLDVVTSNPNKGKKQNPDNQRIFNEIKNTVGHTGINACGDG
jgi:hypothetical protein